MNALRRYLPFLPRRTISLAISLIAITALAPLQRAHAEKLKTIYNFAGGSAGSQPSALVSGPKGDLYAGASIGGINSMIYRLEQNAKGKWRVKPIYTGTFTAGTGTAHELYGFDVGISCPLNSQGCGSIAELTPPAKPGDPWTETVLYNFKGGEDGALSSGITVDKNGTIFGATREGGGTCTYSGLGCGTLFELENVGGKWVETVLHQFKGGADGDLPMAAPSLDKAGNIYVTTYLGGMGKRADGSTPQSGSCEGGGGYFIYIFAEEKLADIWLNACKNRGPAYADGVVDAITGYGSASNSPNGDDTSRSQDFTKRLLPPSKAADAAFIMSAGGGNASDCVELGNGGCGVVALLTAPKNGSKPWALTILHKFTGSDGALPSGYLTAVGAGTLYGVANFGGITCTSQAYGCGTIYKLTNASGSWAWGGAVYKFPGGAHGNAPSTHLLPYKGLLVGTTTLGGANTGCGTQGCGTIFTLTP